MIDSIDFILRPIQLGLIPLDVDSEFLQLLEVLVIDSKPLSFDSLIHSRLELNEFQISFIFGLITVDFEFRSNVGKFLG